MSRREYTRCPDCGKKGVTLRLRPDGEDHYGCRYCNWFFYTIGDYETDREERARWEAANSGQT